MTELALDRAVAALEQGTNDDPFGLLGPHPATVGRRARARRPGVLPRSRRRRAAGWRLPRAADAPGAAPRRSSRWRSRGGRTTRCRSTTGCASAGPTARRAKSSTRTASGASSASTTSTCLREGTQMQGPREARRAPDEPRGHRGRALRRLGPERGTRQRDRRLQLLGRPPPPDAPPGATGRVGDLHPGARERREVQVRDPNRRSAARCS